MEQKLLRAGADRVVSPYQTGALRMAITTLQPHVVDFMSVVAGGHSTDLRLEEMELASASPFVGKRLKELELRQRFGLLVLGIMHDGADMILNPDSTEPLNAGDVLLLLGSPDKLEACESHAAQG